MKRSEVERVASEVNRIYLEHDEPYEAFRALARWHLRAVKRARGRTVGHVFLERECDESGEDCWFEIKGGMLDGPINVRMSQMIHDEVARVVLVPRKRRPK